MSVWVWTAVAVAAALVVAVAVLLAWHVYRARRQAGTQWARRYPPLPAGALPMLDTDPDQSGDDPVRLPFRRS